MRVSLLLSLIPLSLQAMISGEPRFGGTFIGAIVCADGIIIGADSRSTFVDGDDRHFGYVDGISKVFVQQGTAFAVAGLTSVENELFNAFIRRNDFLLARPANEVLYGISLRLPLRNTARVLLLSAGFVDGEAVICAKEPANTQECQKLGVFTNRESASLRRWLGGLKSPPTAQEAATALKQAIRESAAADSTVGGPMSILHLRKDGAPVWIENGTRDSGWSRICDIVIDYRRNKTTIGFTNSKEELDRFLAAICPISR